LFGYGSLVCGLILNCCLFIVVFSFGFVWFNSVASVYFTVELTLFIIGWLLVIGTSVYLLLVVCLLFDFNGWFCWL